MFVIGVIMEYTQEKENGDGVGCMVEKIMRIYKRILLKVLLLLL